MAEKYPFVSSNKAIQAAYEKMRAEGQSHSMADMLAHRQSPGSLNTDRAFQEGRGNGQGIAMLHPQLQKKLRRNYRKMYGRDLPADAQYISRLATKSCDPTAVVQSVGDVARAAIAKGAAYEDLGIKQKELPPPEPKKHRKLGGFLAQRRLKEALKDPANIGKSLEAVKETVLQKHGYNPHE